MMGNIKEVLYSREVPKSMLNNRLTVELCENVHLHYRNLRLEFSKEEFLFLLKHLKSVDEKTIEEFEYGDDKFQSLVQTFQLPDWCSTLPENRIVLRPARRFPVYP